MNIISCPNVSKAYEHSSDKWAKELKGIAGGKLAKAIKEIIQQAGNNDTKLWNFCGKLFTELSIHKYAKNHRKEMELFRKTISARDGTCLAGTSYSIEAAGIRESSILSGGSKHKVIHPYAKNKVAEKILKKWERSKSSKNLRQYAAARLTTKEKKVLSASNVKYLKPSEYSKYRVTFHKGGTIKIGGHTPLDQKYIFALSDDGKDLLAGIKKKGKFHHSSFFAGDRVQSAGDMIIRMGRIVKASLVSGHYHPDQEQGENLRLFLSDSSRLGAEAAKKLPIKGFH